MQRSGPPLHVLHVDVRLLHMRAVERTGPGAGPAPGLAGLMEGLAHRAGIRQALAAARGSPLALAAERIGVPVVSLPWGGAAESFAMRELVRQAQYGWDLFHAHGPRALYMCLLALWLTGSRARLVATWRTATAAGAPANWRRADLVLTDSRAACRFLETHGLERRRLLLLNDGHAGSGTRGGAAGVDAPGPVLQAYRVLVGSAEGATQPRREAGVGRLAEQGQ